MKKNNGGFTLIELLITIAIIGILAAGVIATINPVKRLNQANDSKTKNDIGQIATALGSYYTQFGYYPSALSELVTNQDLKTLPAPAAAGYTAYAILVDPSGCTTLLGTCTDVSVSGVLKAPLDSDNTVWCYRTSTGATTEEVNAAACTP